MNVSIPEDARVIHFDRKSRADALVLSNHRSLESLHAECGEERLLELVKQDGRTIRHIAHANRSFKICLAAVNQDEEMIKVLSKAERQPLEIRIAAVTH